MTNETVRSQEDQDLLERSKKKSKVDDNGMLVESMEEDVVLTTPRGVANHQRTLGEGLLKPQFSFKDTLLGNKSIADDGDPLMKILSQMTMTFPWRE